MKYKRNRKSASKYIYFSEERNRIKKCKKSKLKIKLSAACIFTLIIFSASKFSGINSNDIKSVFTKSPGGISKKAELFLGETIKTLADLCSPVFMPQKDKKTDAVAVAEKVSASDGNQTVSPQMPKEEAFVFSPSNPCPGRISSEFGERVHPLNNTATFHNGIDIAAEGGTQIRAAFDGTVITSEYNEFSGNYIVIDHSNGYTSSYAHLRECVSKKGDIVKKGQLIGYMGATGNATGPHLHFEIRLNGTPLNPMELIKAG
ncbi:MAG: M23 family metallopeptidase [Clostridia bacterium]|nr:M23 family metallopeptidase [Clostridia bacterium]MBO7289359.1 M23 family metallopeptidase [Clostridia bacterium]